MIMTNDYMANTKAVLLAEAKKRKLAVRPSATKADITGLIVLDDKRKKRAAARKKATTKPPVKAKKTVAKKKPALKTAIKKKRAVPASTVKKKAVTAKSTAIKKSAVAKKSVSKKKDAKTMTKPTPKKRAIKAPAIKNKSATDKKAGVIAKAPASKKTEAKAGRKKAGKSKPESAPFRSAIAPKAAWEINIDGEKFYVAKEETDYGQHKEASLQEKYSETKITALARGPYTLFVFWELTEEAIEKARASHGKSLPSLRWTLRLNKTDVDIDGATHLYDVTVDPSLNSYYLTVKEAGAIYSVAIGLTDDEGRFFPIAQSNQVTTPVDRPSDQTDETWSVSDEDFALLYYLSGGGKMAGSSIGQGASYLLQKGEKLFSGGVSSFGASSEREKARDFFFWLDCKLVVRGGTETGAEVTLRGEKIALDANGEFTARFDLPDGVIEIPVTATSADRMESREISPTITRFTRRGTTGAVLEKNLGDRHLG